MSSSVLRRIYSRGSSRRSDKDGKKQRGPDPQSVTAREMEEEEQKRKKKNKSNDTNFNLDDDDDDDNVQPVRRQRGPDPQSMTIDDALLNDGDDLVGGQKLKDDNDYLRPRSSSSKRKKKNRVDDDDDDDKIDRVHLRNDYDSDDDRGYGSHRSQTGSRQGWQDQDEGGKSGDDDDETAIYRNRLDERDEIN